MKSILHLEASNAIDNILVRETRKKTTFLRVKSDHFDTLKKIIFEKKSELVKGNLFERVSPTHSGKTD